jgi:hypothetical protein
MDFERSKGGVLLPVNDLLVGGCFMVQHVRQGEVIDEEELKNLVVNEGLDHILNTVLHGSTQVTAWFLGLFEANYTPVATVNASTITAAATECTAYDEATRVAYDEAAASGQSITNSASKATFTMNATKTVYGAFLVSASAKSATTGVLLSAARFGSSKAVVDDDQLLLTYTFSASSV